MNKQKLGGQLQLEGKPRRRPIRIIQYIGSLNIGGSQAMIMNIYRNIDRTKVQFDFIVDKKNELFFKKEIEQLGGKVFVFDQSFKGYNYSLFVRQWKRFFRDHPEYRVIHCHVRSVASIVLKVSKRYGLLTICHSHNISNGRSIKSIVKNVLQRRIKKYCDYYFACSKKAAEWLFGSKAANSNRCFIVNNAIEVDKYRFSQKHRDEIRHKYMICDDDYLIGHVGRFEGQKNHFFIYEILKKMKDSNIKIMLCGDGSLKSDFQKKISEEGLDDKIIYVGGSEDIFKCYSAFDCFILPSLYEGLGMVIIEAQFNGLPCIASDAIPNDTIITNNITFLPLSTTKWISEIKKMRTRYMGNVALLESAKHYDVKNTAPFLEKFYLEIGGGL